MAYPQRAQMGAGAMEVSMDVGEIIGIEFEILFQSIHELFDHDRVQKYIFR